jgi:cytochrome c oxidase subunit II
MPLLFEEVRDRKDERPRKLQRQRRLDSAVNCEEAGEMQKKDPLNWQRRFAVHVFVLLCVPVTALADPVGRSLSPTNIFAPVSTPAHSIMGLSLFVLAVTAGIFAIVFSLLVYCVVKFGKRANDDGREPPQVYGSNQVELAWTVIPVLIVVVLFLATARVIASIQKAVRPRNAIQVVAIGHQFWWEYRYPDLKVVTANELHVPVSDPAHPTPTFITLLSTDTDHSFWVPRLGGKTDLIPNHPNSMWMDPQVTGLYLGECAQYCGTQHAKMLLRVYVQSRQDFDRWVAEQTQLAHTSTSVSEGQRIFETTACINCHAVTGTVADGRFGPDLTHLMSRETIASGAAPNTPENLRLWIQNPDSIKPGSKMPAMGLSDHQLDAVTAYLATLH